jgi:hypothetical protein
MKYMYLTLEIMPIRYENVMIGNMVMNRMNVATHSQIHSLAGEKSGFVKLKTTW